AHLPPLAVCTDRAPIAAVALPPLPRSGRVGVAAVITGPRDDGGSGHLAIERGEEDATAAVELGSLLGIRHVIAPLRRGRGRSSVPRPRTAHATGSRRPRTRSEGGHRARPCSPRASRSAG